MTQKNYTRKLYHALVMEIIQDPVKDIKQLLFQKIIQKKAINILALNTIKTNYFQTKSWPTLG